MKDQRDTLPIRAYDWLLRKRLIREPQWGQPGFLQRLLRIRSFSALVLALPALILCCWYALVALVAHRGHERLVKVHEPLTIELFQLHLHDRLVRDWRRLTMPEPQHKSMLPTYGLAITAEKLDELERHPPVDEGPSYYVDALLVRNSRVSDVQVRYRGSGARPHNPQQSWKVRTKGGKSVDGFETFHLINTPEAVPFEEDIVLEIAREQSLLVPEYFPFRLLLNKSYVGVYFFEAQADDGLLRRQGRPAGSIYSGGEAPVDPLTHVGTLFRSADHFTKVAQGVHQQLGERVELELLIDAINRASPRMFAEYARSHLDLEKFALFDALDVLFGCSQHDFSDNHKFYYDPYRDRFEPIAWNFRGCRHECEFNRTENPLLLRLKTLPGYLAQRNRLLHELLHGVGSPESLRQRMHRFLDTLQDDRKRDPFWDAHQLLPAMSPYYAQLMRPLNRSLQDTIVETRLFELEQRHRYLSRALANWEFRATLSSVSSQAIGRVPTSRLPRVAVLDVESGGESGYEITRIAPSWANDCRPGAWRVFADTTLDGELDHERDRRLTVLESGVASAQVHLKTYPGVRFAARPAHPRRGRVRAVTEARRYRLYIESDSCETAGLTLDAVSIATGESRRVLAQVATTPTRGLPDDPTCSDTYAETPGYRSPHPWCLAEPASQLVRLGPGAIRIHETTAFGPNQSVVIAPGTTFRMARGASLIFNGHLEAIGTPEQPIRFEPTEESWGGVLIYGPSAQGSQLSYVTISRGTRVTWEHALTPGTLNVQDTGSVELKHCQLLDGSQSAIGIHVADVTDVRLSNSRVFNVAGDGVVIRHSSAKLTGLDVIGIGRDGLAVQGSDVDIAKTRVIAARHDAISAGQAARVALHDSVLAQSGSGLTVREAATVEHEGTLLYKDRTGVYLDSADNRFPSKAKLKGEALYAVGCDSPLVTESKGRTQKENLVERLTADSLEKLRAEVLAISNWDRIDIAIASLLKGSVP